MLASTAEIAFIYLFLIKVPKEAEKVKSWLEKNDVEQKKWVLIHFLFCFNVFKIWEIES